MVAERNSKTTIHLVSGAVRHANTRLTLGNFIADVLISKTGDICCYYTLQRVGSAEVIEVARFDSFGEAEQAAKEALQRWHLRDQEHPQQDSATAG